MIDVTNPACVDRAVDLQKGTSLRVIQRDEDRKPFAFSFGIAEQSWTNFREKNWHPGDPSTVCCGWWTTSGDTFVCIALQIQSTRWDHVCL